MFDMSMAEGIVKNHPASDPVHTAPVARPEHPTLSYEGGKANLRCFESQRTIDCEVGGAG